MASSPFGQNRIAFALDSSPSDDTVANPHSSDGVTVIVWQRQMLILLTVGGTIKAFLGPYFTKHPVDLQDCFPSLPEAMPPAFKKNITLDFRYMSTKTRVFR